MATRAGVSERLFLEIFPSTEECYRAAFDEGLNRLSRTLAEATGRQTVWLERLRAGLVAMLGFFDDEPSCARFLLCEVPRDAALTFDCRQRLHGVLAGLLERGADVADLQATGRSGRLVASPSRRAASSGELVVGGVLSVIRTSLLERAGGKLVELAPPLMAFIVAPYLGHAAARAELEGRPFGASEASVAEPGAVRARKVSRAAALPIRATHRTTLVLRAIARAPYSNNREVAQAAGLADEGQASKLLARLERRGVVENFGVGAARGEPNAWLLTPEGQRVLELLAESSADRAPRRAGGRITGAP